MKTIILAICTLETLFYEYQILPVESFSSGDKGGGIEASNFMIQSIFVTQKRRCRKDSRLWKLAV
jgi:hypothetical protein